MNPFDRSEVVHTVLPAKSLNNLFAGTETPQNPGLAANNWNSAHQDSYCSESVGLEGPTGKKLKVITQLNPYGFTPTMVCNSANQMIAVSFAYAEGTYRLVVFDADCHILSATETANLVPNTFGGGYFYLNSDDDTVVAGNNKIIKYPTAQVARKDEVYPLDPVWTSADVVELVTGSADGNTLYSCLPVWEQDDSDLYWCLLAGSYDVESGELGSHAWIAVVEIVPDSGAAGGCTTTLVAKLALPDQWNNNTFAVDPAGAYFVTNGLNAEGVCDQGFLWAVELEGSGAIRPRWQYAYDNSGYLKPGQTNVGSGTTPTLMDDGRNRWVSITDNAYPRLHVVTVNRDDGSLVAKTPVFPRMRGCDEASLVGVRDRIVVENNFGHTVDFPRSQLVANEPGMAMIQVDPSMSGEPGDVVWEDNRHCFLAMTMLCRESGVLFAHTADWTDDVSATHGPMYYVRAIDSWDGRSIWRIPLGRGFAYCHEYGGVYFNRDGSLYIGTNRYLISIQDYDR